MRYAFSCGGVQVRDLGRSVDFYRARLGMRLRRRERVPATGGAWAEPVSPGSPQLLELNGYPEGFEHFPDMYRLGNELDHLAFDCDDADAAYAERFAAGVKPALPPFRWGDSRLAFVEDPDGIRIGLSSKAPVEAQP